MNFRKKYFFHELKRAIKSKNMLIALGIALLLTVIGSIYSVINNIGNPMLSRLFVLQESLIEGQYSSFFIFLPLIVVLPFSISFSQEYESGMFKNITNKIKVKEYIFIKVVVVAISSMIVTIIPIIIVFSISYGFISAELGGYSSLNFTMSHILEKSEVLYGIIQSLFIVFFGIIIGVMGLAISTFTNKIIALLAPFILTIITANIRIKELYFLSFQTVGDISNAPEMGLLVRAVYGGMLLFISIGIFSYNLHKRCSYV